MYFIHLGKRRKPRQAKNQLLHCLDKFKLHQKLRANGFYARLGCSRDITIATATDVYTFIQLLSQSKKLRPYLKNVSDSETTIRDREAIIENLSHRLQSTKDDSTEVGLLRGMCLVLIYVPEIKLDWIDAFDRIAVFSPTEGDLSYLAKTISDDHSIYLLKNVVARKMFRCVWTRKAPMHSLLQFKISSEY